MQLLNNLSHFFFRYMKDGKILGLVALLFLLTSCGPSRQSSTQKPSQVQITLPSIQKLQQMAKSASIMSTTESRNFSKACFGIHIKGSDISTQKVSECDMPLGLWVGFREPGSKLSLVVPNGKSRTLEVIAYFRTEASEPCPDFAANSGVSMNAAIAADKLAVVGSSAPFDTLLPDVSVSVSIQPPTDSSVNLATQNYIPSSCVDQTHPNPAPNDSPAWKPGPNRLSSASGSSQVQSGGAYKVIGNINTSKNEVHLSGGNYSVRMSRREQ